MKISARALFLAAAVLAVSQSSGYCDSLWTTDGGGTPDALVMDHRAGKVGDIITVLIVEASSVTQKADSKRNRSSSINLEVTDWAHPQFVRGIRTVKDNPANMPVYAVDGAATYSGGGTYTGGYNVQAQVTTKIIEVLPNKNLLVEGSSEIMVNAEKNTVAVSGIVRPQDVSANNTVLSTQLADAKVRLLGKGPLQNKTNRGVFEKILDFIWPF
jgi:flagellar L-ring protein FlgH